MNKLCLIIFFICVEPSLFGQSTAQEQLGDHLTIDWISNDEFRLIFSLKLDKENSKMYFMNFENMKFVSFDIESSNCAYRVLEFQPTTQRYLYNFPYVQDTSLLDCTWREKDEALMFLRQSPCDSSRQFVGYWNS